MAVGAPARARPRSAPQRPPLRVVKGGRRRRWSPVPIVVLVVLTVFGVTALQASMGEQGLHRSTLERQVQEETERLALLRARVAQLSNPQRIADEAARTGMVPMGNPQHLQAPIGSAPSDDDLVQPTDIKKLTSPAPSG